MDTLYLIVAVIAVLLVLSAFFSGSETAVTAASRPRLHQLEKDGNKRAHIVNRLRNRPERLIGSLLVGNNIVNILASALATSVLIALFGDAGVAYSTVAMTLLVIVFSEVLPKTYAIRNPDKLALAVAPLVRIVVAVLTPLTIAIDAVVCGLLALGGKRGTGGGGEAREEELRGAIDLHAVTDDESAHEGHMLRSILDLAEVEVGEVLTHRTDVQTIDAALPPREILRRVLDSPYSRLPLYRDESDNIIGVIHAKALYRALDAAGGDIDKIDVAAAANAPWFIPEQTGLLAQLGAFRRRHEHFAIVVEEYGAVMGIVTLEDIVEEIVGQIHDEHDVPVAGARAQGDGSWIVTGTATIRDLNRELGWNLPDEEATTIAGLVLHAARVIPDEGQSFVFHDYRFDVLRRRANQIRTLRVTPPGGGAARTGAA
ncbi:MAG: HlyC/CorC family transporter [Alphaproteobacteria bacterium]|nr:HlyC/CorC family transporter [Alphaproteobacteria bacterium]